MTAEVLVQKSSSFKESQSADDKAISANETMLAVQAAAFGVLNIIALFYEILKLMVNERNLERRARQTEREMQIKHMEEVSAICKKQGKQLLMTGVAGGVLGIFAGVAPIAGYLGGDKILGFVSKFKPFGWEGLSSLSKYIGTPDDPYTAMKFFKPLSKMLESSGRTSEQMGQVFHTFAEGDRTREQTLGDIRRTDHEEQTRTMDAIREEERHDQGFVDKVLDMDLRAAQSG